MIASAKQRLRAFDAWLMPTVAIIAPLLAPLENSDNAFFATNGLVLRNASVINFLDGCALSIPCQVPGEAGVGLSVCGLAGDDAKILQIGRALEPQLAKS